MEARNRYEDAMRLALVGVGPDGIPAREFVVRTLRAVGDRCTRNNIDAVMRACALHKDEFVRPGIRFRGGAA